MPIKGILRPGHVAIRVLDLDAAVRHYTSVVGLREVTRDNRGRVFLKAWDEWEHHSVILREAEHAGIDYMGWRIISPEVMKQLSQRILDSGLCTECRWLPACDDPGTGERFSFVIPTGHTMELYAEKEIIPTEVGFTNPEPWPQHGIIGMSPTRFDHCLLYGDDVDGTTKLFTEVLGFDLSEKVVDQDGNLVGVFFACGNKAHDVAFIRYPEKGKLHHISFYLDSWSDVLRAADLISMNNVSLDIGPTRHGITRGTTIYFFDPSGNRNEVFCGGYIQYPDKPVIHWDLDELGKGIFYHARQLNEAFLTVVT